jgi:hypothetical protein
MHLLYAGSLQLHLRGRVLQLLLEMVLSGTLTSF